MMRNLIVAVLLAGLAGCAVPQNQFGSLNPTTYDNASPSIGQIAEREVGETIIDESHYQVWRAMEFLEPLEFEISGKRFRAAKGATFTENRVVNGRSAFCGMGAWDTTIFQEGAFSALNICFILDGSQLLTGGNAQPLKLSGGTFVSYRLKDALRDAGGFKRHLLYAGRSGNQLLISYREFKDDLARPAFSQEVSFDLSQGREIGYRGARFEVLDATNIKIRYRLIQSFSEFKN